ncbi:MAG: HAMP domain-containing protein [Herpetosiphonaceae bacterium]|nr:HAMP domain-containing protein [Herpetosiphonaceae bacterium]
MDRSRRYGAWAIAWKARLTARVGFWRALVEMLLAGFVLFLLYWPLATLWGPTWAELLSYVWWAFYAYAAWRLAPGGASHGLLYRIARILLWGMLFGIIGATQGYLFLKLHPLPGLYFGFRLEDIPYPQYLLSSALNTISPFLLTRTLISLWAAGRRRLRWRLTYSYVLVALIATLLITPAQSLYLAVASLAVSPPVLAPGVAAQRIVTAISPLLAQGASDEQVAGVLAGLLDGTVRVPLQAEQPVVEDAAAVGFNGVRQIVVLRPGGIVLTSAGQQRLQPGAPLPAAEATRMAPLLAQLHVGGCISGRPASGSVADSAACNIAGTDGRQGVILLVESRIDSVVQAEADLNRILTLVIMNTATTFSLLLVALLGILVVAGGGGYLLARRLTQRLESLALGTAELAAGQFGRRITIDSGDEIGQLGSDFNSMAARLQEREVALTIERDRAERALAANRQLVANVSHELRTPLTTLRGYLEALEQEHSTAILAHDLAVMQGEVGRLTALIEDLFTLARAEAHQLPLTLEAVDGGELVRELAQTLAPLARRERQIELVTAIPPDLPHVRADRARLGQVVLNLLQNALSYTPPGGIIAVEGSAGDGMVTLVVDDTGIGIPPEELQRVFERFYRSDSSRARDSGGAGIGLALVQELVIAMGGSVAAQSTLGRGSRFSIVLPEML